MRKLLSQLSNHFILHKFSKLQMTRTYYLWAKSKSQNQFKALRSLRMKRRRRKRIRDDSVAFLTFIRISCFLFCFLIKKIPSTYKIKMLPEFRKLLYIFNLPHQALLLIHHRHNDAFFLTGGWWMTDYYFSHYAVYPFLWEPFPDWHK